MNTLYFNQRLSVRILAAVALFSLVASLFPTQAFAATSIFDNSFENTTFATNGWTGKTPGGFRDCKIL